MERGADAITKITLSLSMLLTLDFCLAHAMLWASGILAGKKKVNFNTFEYLRLLYFFLMPLPREEHALGGQMGWKNKKTDT